MAILVRRLEKAGALVTRSDGRQLRSGYVILEPGKEVGEHTTEDGEELIAIFDGKADIISDGHAEMVEAPSVVLIPPHTIHNVKNRSDALLRYVYVVVASPDLRPQRASPQ
ncbi:MAG TPA: cupin domain-containing protein [Conexivisphaerales archaeon]|nr:cupin domain-containing protein [Conexivisphaerales archaeon]